MNTLNQSSWPIALYFNGVQVINILFKQVRMHLRMVFVPDKKMLKEDSMDKTALLIVIIIIGFQYGIIAMQLCILFYKWL